MGAQPTLKCTVVLVGSYARGDFNLWSDIGILLTSSELKGNPLDRLKKVDAPAGFQVIPSPKNTKNKLKKQTHSP
ncbi:MAG: nucleotidyltransferase domain-containing protein [Candidatus Freyarchaeota archaeon]|nr:nucleotidyltransferase domain-containing protein [Candidatus Jordarchaeia archaeon]